MLNKALKILKNNIKRIVLILVIFIVVVILAFIGNKVLMDIRERNINDIDWLEKNVNIVSNDELGSDIKYVKTKSYVDIFKLNYQSVVDDKINELLSDNKYTFDNPLIIYNPYGTNTLSFNIYFNTDDYVSVSYKVLVDDSKISDYSNSFYNSEEYSTSHNYQVIGLIKNHVNYVEFTIRDKDGNEKSNVIEINVPDTSSNVDLTLDVKDGDSNTELENGLYAVLGHDKSFDSNVYLYDNNGILRGELPIKGYRVDRIEFIDDNLLYSYKKNGFVMVNRLGKIINEYDFSGYTMHHDYIYDESSNSLLILVNKTGEDTIEDKVISLNLDTKEVKEIIDMRDLLPEIYDTAVSPEGGNTYGGDELDWIHLNSLSLVNDNDIVLSSREISTIIYVEDVFDNPKIKYLIADESVFEGTSYVELLLDKDGDFVSQAGQHTITYIDNPDSDDTYYLAMYNNNFGSYRTRPDFDWSNYKGVGTYTEGDKSMYYLYEVNEKDNSYKLVKEIDLPYSSVVSSVQDVFNNYVTSSGMDHSFGEYDSNGVLIKQFNYTSKKYSYRVFKYDFNGIWFN